MKLLKIRRINGNEDNLFLENRTQSRESGIGRLVGQVAPPQGNAWRASNLSDEVFKRVTRRRVSLRCQPAHQFALGDREDRLGEGKVEVCFAHKRCRIGQVVTLLDQFKLDRFGRPFQKRLFQRTNDSGLERAEFFFV